MRGVGEPVVGHDIVLGQLAGALLCDTAQSRYVYCIDINGHRNINVITTKSEHV